ncbi:MAG: alpha/beta fold hydrolase [Phycisphaerae bacterium]|jgi:pimeloyl-ACP methyl ester carboxylesterase
MIVPRLAVGLGLVCFCVAAPPAEPADDDGPQTVQFNAADGFWIYADYQAPTSSYVEAPIVILLHAEQADRRAWAPLIPALREAGFAVLAMDLRGHGESSDSGTRRQATELDARLFRDMQADLRGAYDWLAAQKGLDRARFTLVAAGRTVGVATSYAAADCSVDAVVCLSPQLGQEGLDPVADLSQIHGRQLLFLGARDERQVCETLAKRTKGARTWFCDSDKHGTDLLGNAPDIEKQIVRFLGDAVGRPSSLTVYGSIRSNIYHQPGSGWIAEISPTNLRHYSSPREAESRGLRAARSDGPRRRRSPSP